MTSITERPLAAARENGKHMKRILAVDGNSILNRAFYGIRPLSTHDGLPTNALYGMANMLMRQLATLSPTNCAVAFDLKAPTFRHKKYDAYKAGRKPMPEELALQLPWAHELCRALGFTVIETEGYEADDILGTIAAKCDTDSDPDTRCFIFTGDRDSLQLISDRTTVLLATNKENISFDRERFFVEYGIDPEAFIDMKAIMGDTSDNIPGIPGIGEKGAQKLIAEFGSLDGVYAGYASSPGIKPAMAAKLAAGRESAYLSRELATIYRAVPTVPDIAELACGRPDPTEARRILTRLEFGRLLEKLDLPPEKASPHIVSSPTESIKLGDRAMLLAILNRMSTKTMPQDATSEEKGSAECTAVAVNEDEISLFDGQTLASAPIDEECIAALCHARGISCYDCKAVRELIHRSSSGRLEFSTDADIYDVMLAAYVLDPQGHFELPALCEKYLGTSEGMSDAERVYRLRRALDEKLDDEASVRLFRQMEMPLAGVLADMEEAGFLIDRAGLEEYGKELSARADSLAAEVMREAGMEFNINSPKQLGEVLFERLEFPHAKKTKSGYSTNADILEKLAPDHKIVQDVLEYRKLSKLYSTYIVGLLKVADEHGRVHTSFKQTGTATGRLSSAEPNLQNIPIRTDEGRELRKYFLAAPGRVLVDADYSQIELRLLAHISGDSTMIEAFRSGADIHTSTAAAVFGISQAEVTSEQRKRAKAVNFGIVYGISDFSLAGDLSIPVKQARAYIANYLASYPEVNAYLKDIVAEARQNGYVTTLFGRRRYIPEISGHNAVARKFGERVAMNSPIQGSAADIVKLAMLNVSRRIEKEGLDAKLILQVHDELIVEAAQSDAERAALILREEMEGAAALSVPLTVDLSTGRRWFEM